MRPIIEFCESCRERRGKQVIAFKIVDGTPMCRSCFGGETRRPVKSEPPPQKREPKIEESTFAGSASSSDKETLSSLYDLRGKLQDSRDNLVFELEEAESDILAVKRVLELLAEG